MCKRSKNRAKSSLDQIQCNQLQPSVKTLIDKCWYYVLSKYQLKSFIARQQGSATLTPQSPTLNNIHAPSKYSKLHLTFTLKENSLRKHTVLQKYRIIYYTPASFQDVGKKFLRFHCPFDVHVTVHRVKFLVIKPTRCTDFSHLFLE